MSAGLVSTALVFQYGLALLNVHHTHLHVALLKLQDTVAHKFL